MRSAYILGSKVNISSSREEYLAVISDFLAASTKKSAERHAPAIICTVNPEMLLAAEKDTKFRAVINNSFLSIPDGHGICLAHEYLSKARRGSSINTKNFLTHVLLGIYIGVKNMFSRNMALVRYPGSDLIYDICAIAEKENLTVALIGGWPKDYLGRMVEKTDRDVATEAAQVILKKFPNLKIVLATSQVTPKSSDDKKTASLLLSNMKKGRYSHIDIVFAAFGHGTQEHWLYRNMPLCHVRLGIGVGGSFEFVSGSLSRAPIIFQKAGLEWLFRLFQEPWRIKRIFNAVGVFPYKVFRSSINP